MDPKQQIRELLEQADDLLAQAQAVAFEQCTPSIDGVSDIDIRDIRDAVASVHGNL